MANDCKGEASVPAARLGVPSGAINRRGVTAGIVALGAGRVLGANDRIRVGLIGCGGRGRGLWRNFLRQPDVEPAAVCDVYEPFRTRAVSDSNGVARPVADFRRLLDRNDIDAVIVATPDHWHAIQTVMACRAGKDVFVEKPLCLMPFEGQAMAKAARTHNRIVQVGSQQRSGAHYREAMELIWAGGLGRIHHITANWTRNMMPGFRPLPVGPKSASEIDWDLWLGPAPYVPFSPFRCIYNYRWFWDYSGGQMTNWGAHSLDIARWALREKAPRKVASFGGRLELNDGGETPDIQQTIYEFPGCVVGWVGREVSAGSTNLLEFHGTKGSMVLTRERFDVSPEVWTGSGQDGKTPAMAALRGTGGDLDARHIRNFLDCVRSRREPNASIEEGRLTAMMCQLGNAALRVGRVLQWDADREEVIGDAEANRALSYRAYRQPWSLD